MELVNPKPGTYVLAVSGGVDSVVLLDLLVKRPALNLVVAHFDHGIRPDSVEDVALVRQLAEQHGLPFMTERVELGAGASEATARQARYDFLRQVKKQHGAQAIITAHHQDDVLETAIFNMLRGTGRRGLTSLQSTQEIVRPMLGVPKSAIRDFALQRKLSWREDTTNHDERYARNYIRHRLLVRFDADARQQLLALISHQQDVNIEIDALLAEQIHGVDTELRRQWFTDLPHDISKEVLATFLRQNGLSSFDKKTIERLSIQAKTKSPRKRLDVMDGRQLVITTDTLALTPAER